MASKIQWTDETWNPVTGCTKVSQGCKHCYAEGIHRMRHKAHLNGKAMPPQYARPFSVVQCHEDRLEKPLHWRKPRKVFVNSMSDLFHPDVPGDFQCHVFGVMHSTPRHTYQVLTKRPEGLRKFIIDHGLWPDEDGFTACGEDWPLPNVWLGVSAEDQATADERIPQLLQIPAAVRFVSVEPMLGPVDLGFSALTPKEWCQLHWVICGGESGPGARPMHPDWARSLRDQCAEAEVPFLFKQWGPRGAGRLIDGVLYDEYPREITA